MAWWRHFDLYFSRARVFPRPQDSRRDRRKLLMFLPAWLLLDSCSYAHEDHWFEAEEQAGQIVSQDSLLSVVSILVRECLVNRGVSNFPLWYLPNLFIMYIPQFNLVKAFRKYRCKGTRSWACILHREKWDQIWSNLPPLSLSLSDSPNMICNAIPVVSWGLVFASSTLARYH